MAPEAAHAAFAALSAVLTDEPALPAASVDRHLSTLSNQFGEIEVEAVLDRFVALQAAGGDLTAAVQGELLGDAQLGPTVRAMLLLWFTGQMVANDQKPGKAEDYLEALMWTVVGSHAPAFSNAYYGHWRYPPDTGA